MNDQSSDRPEQPGWLSLRGRIDRFPFAAIGIGLFSVKFALDCGVARFVFGESWSLSNYLSGQQVELLRSFSPADRLYFSTMGWVAVPFIWVGVVLTVRRLRSAGMPMWLVVMFFLPTINILFFVIMSVAPPRRESESGLPSPRVGRGSISRLLPRIPIVSAILAVVFTVLIGLAMTGLSVYALGNYGAGLFVATPFCLGLISTIVFGFCGYRRRAAFCYVSLATILGLVVILFVLGTEGLGCLVMALPIWLVAGLLGGLVGAAIQTSWIDEPVVALVALLIIVSLPALLGAEHALQPRSAIHRVSTQLDIDAPPEIVWQNVVSFPDLPPPTEWVFRTGIAYPTSAHIDNAGPNAERRCEFNTGTFVEPIEVWDPPRLLRFAVSENPPPMREWTFYDDVHPPHLEGYLFSRAGQFLLTPLPGGRTRLEGSTWYEHNMRPDAYWRLWSDRIIATIHRRVLRHIKVLSESQRGTKPAG